jgi:hypothetical protein
MLRNSRPSTLRKLELETSLPFPPTRPLPPPRPPQKCMFDSHFVPTYLPTYPPTYLPTYLPVSGRSHLGFFLIFIYVVCKSFFSNGAQYVILHNKNSVMKNGKYDGLDQENCFGST